MGSEPYFLLSSPNIGRLPKGYNRALSHPETINEDRNRNGNRALRSWRAEDILITMFGPEHAPFYLLTRLCFGCGASVAESAPSSHGTRKGTTRWGERIYSGPVPPTGSQGDPRMGSRRNGHLHQLCREVYHKLASYCVSHKGMPSSGCGGSPSEE